MLDNQQGMATAARREVWGGGAARVSLNCVDADRGHGWRRTSFLWASLSAAALRTASRVALVVAAARASGGTKGLVLGCLTSSGECAKKQICAAGRM